MTRVSFGNPVQGPIRPPGSPKIVGSFPVTATFQQHIDGHRNPGVDISNGSSGDPILAMADGKVTRAGLMGAAKVVRILHDDFDDVLESGYAHLATIDVKLGNRVTRGQHIGTLGKTGADAFHLHLGLKRGKTEIDAWPLLDQNQETDMLKGSHPVRLFNRKGLILGDNTRFRESPTTTASIIRTYDKDTEIAPDFVVDGGSANGSVQWYATWGNTVDGTAFGYIHVSTVGPLEPIEHS